MEKLNPTPELKLTNGNLEGKWRRFKEQFEWYLKAIDAANAADKRKVAILLTVARPEAQKVFHTFQYTVAIPAVGDQPAIPAELADQYKTVIAKFAEYCIPRNNVIYERYVFNMRVQEEDETVDGFVPDLRVKAQSCEFRDLEEDLIHDRFVVGIRDRKLKEKTLRDPGLTLDMAV